MLLLKRKKKTQKIETQQQKSKNDATSRRSEKQIRHGPDP
jgi:hypothetical protein